MFCVFQQIRFTQNLTPRYYIIAHVFNLFAPPAVRCPPLSQPSNGNYSCSKESQIFNSTCHFKCHLGFFMIGSSAVTCAANGHWTGPRPVCTSNYIQVQRFCLAKMNFMAEDKKSVLLFHRLQTGAAGCCWVWSLVLILLHLFLLHKAQKKSVFLHWALKKYEMLWKLATRLMSVPVYFLQRRNVLKTGPCWRKLFEASLHFSDSVRPLISAILSFLLTVLSFIGSLKTQQVHPVM